MEITHKQNGFTLMELALIVAVLGILTTITIPRHFNLANTITEEKNLTNIKTIEDAILMEYSYRLMYDTKIPLTDIVNDYNRNPDKFFKNSKAPRTSSGNFYSAAIDEKGFLIFKYE